MTRKKVYFDVTQEYIYILLFGCKQKGKNRDRILD